MKRVHAGRRKEEFILTLMRMAIIYKLKEKGAITKTELAKYLGVPRRTIYLNLDILKDSGLIYERKDKEKEGKPLLIGLNQDPEITPLNSEIIEILKSLYRLNQIIDGLKEIKPKINKSINKIIKETISKK